MSIFRGPIKNPNRLRNGDLPYVADAVHFDGVSYLQSDRLSLPPQGLIGGGADGTQITIAGWFKTVWDNTFTPQSPAGKGNIIPVFVVDPDINYGPSVIAQSSQDLWFAVVGLNANDPTSTVKIYRSTDAINWTATDLTSYFNFISDGIHPIQFFEFRNGVGIITGTSSVNSQVEWNAITSIDQGKTWQLLVSSGPGHSLSTPVFDPVANQWSLVNGNGGATVTFQVPWARNLYVDSQDGDNTGNIPTGGFTQIQVDNIDANTNTLLTTTDGGNTYKTTLTVTSPDGMSAWSLVYQKNIYSSQFTAPGKSSLQVRTSIVCQNNDNFSDITPGVQDKITFWAVASTAPPQSTEQGLPYGPNGFNANGPLWQQPVWMHLMFTCNSDTGQANIYINGVQTDLSGSSIEGGTILTVLPFTTRINQKIGVLGGDSLGSYYIGDIADFSVWNCDLSNITIIDNNNRQGLPSPYNIFIDTRTNGPTSPQFQYNTVRFITSSGSGLSPTGFFIPEPVILLTGDRITFPQNLLGSAAPFRIVGNLSNAATAPQSISSP